MRKLAKWIYIILFLVLIMVLVLYVMDRFGGRTSSLDSNKQYCGDQICQLNENHDNCCMDCGCLNNQVCIDNECQTSVITYTTSIPSDTMQTTVGSMPSGGGTGSSDETSSESGEEPTETTPTTTIYKECSYDYCELCENKTACYNVGCVWCLSNRCLKICKGQASIN